MNYKLLLLAMGVMLTSSVSAFAEDIMTFEMTIKDHKFSPAKIQVPEGKPFILHVKNLDSTKEEFESRSINIEKVIAGNGESDIFIHPLQAGKYGFVEEKHEDSARGVVVVQ